MIARVRAGWVVPIATSVLRNGWLDIDVARSEIVALGADDAPSPYTPDRTLDLRDAVVLPGLVNAHTHLELSHLSGRVPPADAFVPWVRSMLAARFAGEPLPESAIAAAVATAIARMEASGTVAVGDIANTDVAVAPLMASSLHGVHFREALAFPEADAARVADDARRAARDAQMSFETGAGTRLVAATAPHAPYSTSAPLIQALASGLRETGGLASMHVGESAEEIEFLAHGTGAFRTLLSDLGKWDDGWRAPGAGPVDYLSSIGALHAQLLVVHGTQLTEGELATLTAAGATLVLCARSNRWVGAGTPPVAKAFASGVRLAIGTDSLASVEDLNLFAELAVLRAIAPTVPASRLLHAATRGGAEALGCTSLGYLAPGATSRVVVRVPPAGVQDVEEWLVSGAADTSDLRWLDELVRPAG